MQLNFLYLNLHTEYSAEGPIPHEMQRRPCYGAISGDLKRHTSPLTQTYHIRLYNTPKKLKENWNNYCFVNIAKYLDYLKLIFPFTYNITEEAEDQRYVLNLTISDTIGIFHCYILTSIRPLYEYPYNFALHDAIKLYESGDCPNLTIVDCFNLCLVSNTFSFGGGHSMVYDTQTLVKPMTSKELMNRNKTTDTLNYWYPHVCPKVASVKIDHKDHIENIMNTYHRRHKIYMKNYNELMKHV